MKLTLLLGLVVGLTAYSGGGAETNALKSELRTEFFKTATGEEFCLELPSGWKAENDLSAGSAISTLRLINSDGTSLLLISVVPVPSGVAIDSPEDLEQMLIKGTPNTPNATEPRKLNVIPFQSRYGFGLYASSLDTRYATETPPKGHFRFSTTFVLNCQSNAVTATFLSNEEPVDSVDLAVMLLKNLRKKAS